MGTTKVIAAVLAAGSSTRMLGDTPKQFQNYKTNYQGLLISRNMVEIVCEKLGKICEEIVLAVPPGSKSNSILPSRECGAKISVIEGGQNRIDTFFRCIRCDVVRRYRAEDVLVVHDAARPFFEVEYTKKQVRQLILGYNAVLPVMEMYETIGMKYEKDSYEAVNRNNYLIAETPEVYRIGFIRSVPKPPNGAANSMFDWLGSPQRRKMYKWKVKFVPSSPLNKKVTLPTDMYGFKYYVEEMYGV